MAALAHTHRRLRRLALAAAVLDVVGARVATGRGLVAEPLLITAPAFTPTAVVLAGWGTAVSGPLLVDVALLALGSRADEGQTAARRTIWVLGWLRLVGVLAEPATWGRRAPRWAMLLSTGHVAVAALMIHNARARAAVSTAPGPM